MEVHFEISIVCMDESCNNSTSYIDIDRCDTVAEAIKTAKKTEQYLKSGKYDYCLPGVKYVYVTALPHDEEMQCLVGLAWSYDSNYYARKGTRWETKKAN